MRVPSANTRASRNVRSTASQPLIEKPAGDRLQSRRVRRNEWIARSNGLHNRQQTREDDVVQKDHADAQCGDHAQAEDR